MLRLVLFASGTGTTAEAVISACQMDRIAGEVVLVVGNNSRAEVLARARRLGVVTRHLSGHTHPDPDLLDAEILRTLRSAGATHVVLAGYMKKLGPRTLEAFAGRIFNTHPALLPAFGGQGMYGARVHQAVLESGTAITGATVHHVEAEYDTGPIIAQAQVAVFASDTVDSLATRVMERSGNYLCRHSLRLLELPTLDPVSLSRRATGCGPARPDRGAPKVEAAYPKACCGHCPLIHSGLVTWSRLCGLAAT